MEVSNVQWHDGVTIEVIRGKANMGQIATAGASWMRRGTCELADMAFRSPCDCASMYSSLDHSEAVWVSRSEAHGHNLSIVIVIVIVARSSSAVWARSVCAPDIVKRRFETRRAPRPISSACFAGKQVEDSRTLVDYRLRQNRRFTCR